jgi:thiol-disulfide isomerase/thioredoxin
MATIAFGGGFWMYDQSPLPAEINDPLVEQAFLSLPDDPSPRALSLVVFVDYSCPSCKKSLSKLLQLEKMYEDRLQLLIRNHTVANRKIVPFYILRKDKQYYRIYSLAQVERMLK